MRAANLIDRGVVGGTLAPPLPSLLGQVCRNNCGEQVGRNTSRALAQRRLTRNAHKVPKTVWKAVGSVELNDLTPTRRERLFPPTGPGSSSILGMLQEQGPLLINQTGGLFENPYAWTKLGHLVVLESPAGVGYSYCFDKVRRQMCIYARPASTEHSRARFRAGLCEPPRRF